MPDVIVIESPNKRKKIGAIVKGARILATVGHFKNLPKKDMGVDLSTLEPEFIISEQKRNTIDTIRKAATGNKVYIATDPDREGYAIGTHVYQEIRGKASSVHRLEIREITEKGIKEAFAKSIPFGKTNKHLYDAFLGRRIGDRIVGYTLSPAACRALRGSFSVGRVQSPAVRLLVEREREIRAFKSEQYWVVDILLEKDGVRFKAFHTDGNIKDKARADAILEKVLPATFALATDVEEKVTRQSPRPPFTTSDLQATAAAQMRFTTDRTMRLAQELFEAGLISYHRSDSIRIADEFIADIREQIRTSYGASFVPAAPRKYKSKASQAEAHEAIRPTNMHALSDCGKVVAAEKLTEEHARFYELIYKRTVASQMADVLFDSTTILFDVTGEAFKSKGRVVKFEGFQKLYRDTEEVKADKETAGEVAPPPPEDQEQHLPKVQPGDNVPKIGQDLEQKQTRPPGRYSEGTLVKALEKLGIGRPSTYVLIVKTIKNRRYAEVIKGKLKPTRKGETVCDFLTQNYKWVVDYNMTKSMEERLDEIEEKGADWKAYVRDLIDKSGHNGGGEKHKGGGPPPGVNKALRPLSEKQLSVIYRHAPEEIKKKVGAGDFETGRGFLEEFFSKLKKGKG